MTEQEEFEFRNRLEQEQQSTPAPVSRPLPANAGLANLGASVAGLPVDTAQNVLNLGRAGVGTAASALGRPDLAPDLQTGAVGGSDWLKNMLRQAASRFNLPGINPDNPTPGSGLGTLQYDLTSRGAMLPGGALPAIASVAAEKIGGPEWAGVGAMTPSAATAAYNALRAPELARQQARNTVRDQTLADATKEGYVTPPSIANPSFLGNRFESVGGKAAVKQDATLRNQEVTNDVARREAGLAENAPITPSTLAARRTELAEPYRQVAALSPWAQLALEQLKTARFKATQLYEYYKRQGNPETLAAAKNYDAKAETYEKQLEVQAEKFKRPELIPQLREARTAIAKTYDVERALNLGDGTVDARELGKMLDQGRPLSGGLETAAKYAVGPGAQVTRAGALTPPPGVSALEPLASAGLTIGGASAFGPFGMAAGLLPFVRPAVRSAVLSGPYRSTFGQPTYEPRMQPENQLQMLIRQGILNQGPP